MGVDDHDFASYQSKETAWRYDSRMTMTLRKIEDCYAKMDTAQQELIYLLEHPPLYDTFNWSA